MSVLFNCLKKKEDVKKEEATKLICKNEEVKFQIAKNILFSVEVATLKRT